MSTATLEKPAVRVNTSTGDHDLFAHYANKRDIMESAWTGTPVEALCGKVWVPGRDPLKFPVCPTCRELYASFDGVA